MVRMPSVGFRGSYEEDYLLLDGRSRSRTWEGVGEQLDTDVEGGLLVVRERDSGSNIRS